jgi:hypothetical protein
MKRLFLSLFFLSGGSLLFCQTTATNFNANDCTGANHDLFTDLNSGKVVVLIWVMPCVTCINPALVTQTEVKNLQAANPGKILFYLADDYANTSCATLQSWCNSNGINKATLFSNSAIKMTDYGDPGMPKVIVAGGSAHKLYYNQNAPDITGTGIRDGINAALADLVISGESAGPEASFSFGLYPNPSSDAISIKPGTAPLSDLVAEISDLSGRLVKQMTFEAGKMENGTFDVDTRGLASGTYIVRLTSGELTAMKKLVIN